MSLPKKKKVSKSINGTPHAKDQASEKILKKVLRHMTTLTTEIEGLHKRKKIFKVYWFFDNEEKFN